MEDTSDVEMKDEETMNDNFGQDNKIAEESEEKEDNLGKNEFIFENEEDINNFFNDKELGCLLDSINELEEKTNMIDFLNNHLKKI